MSFFHVPDGNFQMFYEEFSSSSPVPVLYIHGNLGSNHWWYPLLNQMREQGRGKFHDTSFAVEFRGCGRSEFTVSETELFPIDQVVEDLGAFIQNKMPGGCHIVGHSTGGFLALKVAAKYSQLVKGLILIDPVGAHGIHFGDELFPIYEEMKRNLDLVDKVIRKTVFRKTNIDSQLWSEICQWVQIAVGRLGSSIVRSLRDVDFTQQFSKISARILIIHGKQDGLIPVESSEYLKKILPQANLNVLPDIGHSPNLEDPAVIAFILGEQLGN